MSQHRPDDAPDQLRLAAAVSMTLLATIVVLTTNRLASAQTGTTNCQPSKTFPGVCPDNSPSVCRGGQCIVWSKGYSGTPPNCTSSDYSTMPVVKYSLTLVPPNWMMCTGTGTSSTASCTLAIASCGLYEFYFDPVNISGTQTCHFYCGSSNTLGYCKANSAACE